MIRHTRNTRHVYTTRDCTSPINEEAKERKERGRVEEKNVHFYTSLSIRLNAFEFSECFVGAAVPKIYTYIILYICTHVIRFRACTYLGQKLEVTCRSALWSQFDKSLLLY